MFTEEQQRVLKSTQPALQPALQLVKAQRLSRLQDMLNNR
jgi:hypothetical protein